MRTIATRAAILGASAIFALGSGAARADITSDLKAEIEAQRAQLEAQRVQMEAQRARLEALEKRLDAAASGQLLGPAKEPATVVASSEPATGFSFGPPGTGITWQVTPADSVTLYGLLDITISNISNANAKGDHVTSYQTSWFSGDRWGISGKHALGPTKPSVIFKLESEFTLNTGEMDTPGVLFNRDAWIGFESDDLGKLTLGRQNALARDYSGIYGDPYGSAQVTLEEGGYTNTNNFKQLIFYAGSATGTRYDRGVVWKKKWGSSWVTGLGYQFGGIAGDFSNNSTQTAAFGYNGGVFNVAGFYNHAKVNDLTHQSYSVGGNVVFNPLIRVNAGYFHYKADQAVVGERTDNAYTVSTKISPEGPVDFEVGYQILKAKNAGLSGSGNVLNAYASTSGVTKANSGDKKTLYASFFYHLDRRTELYLAADYMKLTNGYTVAVTNGHDTQAEVAAGMRFRF